jgi:chromosome partitioning protein
LGDIKIIRVNQVKLEKQVIIAVLSNSGGAGKTTAVRNIAYEMGRVDLKVALIDLDPQHNLDMFCGFPLVNSVEGSIVDVLGEKSDADWNLVSVPDENIDVCRGHLSMADFQSELVIRRRSEHILAQKLLNCPLPHNVILLDCPATLGKICENAIVAADYILIPLILEDKALTGLNGLIGWLKVLIEDLKLTPPPKILGIIPNAYDKTEGTHRACLEQLQRMSKHMNLNLYPTIDYSSQIKNSNANGLSIGRYRPTHKLTQQFRVLTSRVLEDCKNG